MKTYCKHCEMGYPQIYGAIADWSSHDSGRKNRWRVKADYGSDEALTSEIAHQIKSRTLEFQPMQRYAKSEHGKARDLTVESCKQQICDYMVVHALEPMIRAKIGFWQYGGPHVRSNIDLTRAVKRWERTSRYWVHLDVRKCYQSIRCDFIRSVLRKYVRSPDVLYAADRLLSMHGETLALGNYLSLKLAQLMLSFGYHHVESLHKVRRGKSAPLVKHQCWYMDDVWLFGDRKRDIQSAARELERYLAGFGLSLHPWQVCRVGDDEPVDVAGYVVRPSRTSLRGPTFLRLDRTRRRFRRRHTLTLARSLASRWGLLTHADAWMYRRRHADDFYKARLMIARNANGNQERDAVGRSEGRRRAGVAA
jgi:RNA-directed DNA polymerase